MTSVTPSECPPLYPYTPSLILAVIAICLYTVLTTIHAARMLGSRTWDNIYFVIGGICLVAGFGARTYSSQNICSTVAFQIQSILLVLGPTLFMFTVALTQTKFIEALGASTFVWVPISMQRRIYLSINAVLAVIQFAGMFMLVSGTDNPSLAPTAGKTIVATFVAQMVFWAFLLAENVYFSIKLGRYLKRLSSSSNAAFHETPASRFGHWKRWNQLFGLAIAIIGFGRNLVRLTALGGVAFLRDNEWPAYAFDGYQMVVVMGAWAVWYLPARCVSESAVTSETSVELEAYKA